jgi:DNA-binding NarL/FixJ family response regulator
MKQTRVMIVNDHPMVAEGIRSILETYDELNIVACLTNGEDALKHLEASLPDVVLLDLNTPGMGGLTATELILERAPSTRVLILSMHDSPEYIATALNHGASGYILKDVPTDEIKIAIDAASKDEQYLCTGSQAALGKQGASPQSALIGRE